MEEYIEEVVKYSFETRRENLAASAAAEYMSADEFLLRFPEKMTCQNLKFLIDWKMIIL